MSAVVAPPAASAGQRAAELFRSRPYALAVVMAVVLLAVNLALQPSFDPAGQINGFAPLAIAAIASTPAILSGRGGIDMSISPLMTFIAAVYAVYLAPAGLGGLVSVPIVLAVGAAVGIVNGLLVVVVRLQPVVATLGMYFVLAGLNVKLLPQPVAVESGWLGAGGGTPGGVPLGLVFVLIPVVIWILVRSTALGRSLYTVGGNDAAAFSSGVDVGRTRILAYGLGGLFAAVGGLSLVSLIHSAASATTNSFTLLAIAAVVLGGTSLMGGRGGIIGAIAGAATIVLLQSLLGAVQVSQVWLQIFYGALLLAAIMIGALFTRSTDGGS